MERSKKHPCRQVRVQVPGCVEVPPKLYGDPVKATVEHRNHDEELWVRKKMSESKNEVDVDDYNNILRLRLALQLSLLLVWSP